MRQVVAAGELDFGGIDAEVDRAVVDFAARNDEFASEHWNAKSAMSVNGPPFFAGHTQW